MPNPWQDIDKLVARHRADLERARAAVSEAKATSLKVLETGIWRCRFRPFKSEPVFIRGGSASELIEKLARAVETRAAAREAAAKARAEERRAHRDAVAAAKTALRELGAKRVRVKRIGDPPNRSRRWTCRWKRAARGFVELDEPSAKALIAAVRRLAEAG
jgi:hypothetical protein